MSTDHSADTGSPSAEPIGSLAPQTGDKDAFGPRLGLGGTAWTIPVGMGSVPKLVTLGATTVRPGQAAMFAAVCPGLRTTGLQPSGFVTPRPDPTLTLEEGRAAGYVEEVSELTWLAVPSGRPGDALPLVAYCVQSRSDGVNHGGWLSVSEEASALKYPVRFHA